MTKVRVRFAPSPTGPLHIGGVRTALYNYLYAKKHGGDFLLRIEDTDQTRYVEGAEDYIQEALEWFGLTVDEGPTQGGEYGPYRQSERKSLYRQYAEQLVASGHAYYAFDSSEDLAEMRARYEAQGVHSPKYGIATRDTMKNSFTLSEEEVERLKAESDNVVIRLAMPKDEKVTFEDEVRGDVTFDTNELDDKVILKGDGMPTYHLANIVDDHLMKITHVIRGEEWLSSTAHHVLMYRFFNWEAPSFAHLPLILKPSGKGKLSKRDGAKFGFPVFPLEWDAGEETYAGFREDGYLPEAVLNFIALLGWNPGNDEEMFSLEELVEEFSLEKIVKSGARFDVDKSRWFNQQYLIKADNTVLAQQLMPLLKEKDIDVCESYVAGAVELMKERVHMLPQILEDGDYLFERPKEYDEKNARKRFKPENKGHLSHIIELLGDLESFASVEASDAVLAYMKRKELGMGAIMPMLRIALCGTMKGPDLYQTMELLGQEETVGRLTEGMEIIERIYTEAKQG